MIELISSLCSMLGTAIRGVVILAVTSVGTFFMFERVPVSAPSPVSVIQEDALPITQASTTPAPFLVPLVPEKRVSIPVGVAPVIAIKPVLPVTSTEEMKVGKTILAVQSIPLLFGGAVQAGESVPIAYLQITNVGDAGTVLEGFQIQQNGSASTKVITELSTIDDIGGSQGLSGGEEDSRPFDGEKAVAPTKAYFAPGQMRLFTIQARVSKDITAYLGEELRIDLAGLITDAKVQGVFPIRGTTWVLQ